MKISALSFCLHFATTLTTAWPELQRMRELVIAPVRAKLAHQCRLGDARIATDFAGVLRYEPLQFLARLVLIRHLASLTHEAQQPMHTLVYFTSSIERVYSWEHGAGSGDVLFSRYPEPAFPRQ